ncbi:DBP2, partial [Symbiodinium microadriaticum]
MPVGVMAEPQLALVSAAEPERASAAESVDELEHRKQVRVKLISALCKDTKLKTTVVRKKRFTRASASKACQKGIKMNMAVLKHVAVAWAKHRLAERCCEHKDSELQNLRDLMQQNIQNDCTRCPAKKKQKNQPERVILSDAELSDLKKSLGPVCIMVANAVAFFLESHPAPSRQQAQRAGDKELARILEKYSAELAEGAGQSSAQAKHGSELCSETAACPLQLVSFVFMGVDEDGVGVGPMETEPVTAPAAAMQTRPEAPPPSPPDTESSVVTELEAELGRFDPLRIFEGIGDRISGKKDEMHPDVQRVLASEGAMTESHMALFEVFCRTVVISATTAPGLRVKMHQKLLGEEAEQQFFKSIEELRKLKFNWSSIYDLQSHAKPPFDQTWKQWVSFAHYKEDAAAWAEYRGSGSSVVVAGGCAVLRLPADRAADLRYAGSVVTVLEVDDIGNKVVVRLEEGHTWVSKDAVQMVPQAPPPSPPDTESSVVTELEAELGRFDPLRIFEGIGDRISAKKDEMHPDFFKNIEELRKLKFKWSSIYDLQSHAKPPFDQTWKQWVSFAHYKEGPVSREDILQEVVVFEQGTWEERDKAKQELLYAHLREVLASDEHKILVFVSRKNLADTLSKRLQSEGFKANVMHGGKSQESRLNTLEDFRTGKTKLLVTTDVM